MKKAIVTGSNGFIGSNVCKRLCADGIKVFAVVKDQNESIDNIISAALKLCIASLMRLNPWLT